MSGPPNKDPPPLAEQFNPWGDYSHLPLCPSVLCNVERIGPSPRRAGTKCRAEETTAQDASLLHIPRSHEAQATFGRRQIGHSAPLSSLALRLAANQRAPQSGQTVTQQTHNQTGFVIFFNWGQVGGRPEFF